MLSRDFILWLEGYLDNVPPGFGLNKDKTQKVKDRLNSIFKHEIDPQEDKGRNPQELRNLHSGTSDSIELPDPLGGFDGIQRDMC
jgi:hypothetical protein